jgi:hypothetical protein
MKKLLQMVNQKDIVGNDHGILQEQLMTEVFYQTGITFITRTLLT